ncbi:hypothetical protein L8T19_15605 [Enterobacter bugandensis]|uniref:hypothetical protein n=1 Tax=Enterobacter TaxID=547 RepID=UPI001F3B441D|nr:MULTISPECIES: hypothetical protein [Enterobacter]MCF8585046.1 hypothetical protein [Enterobacter asburiae]MCK6779331.1 hypothetical protein [Enterobacter bugandensis]
MLEWIYGYVNGIIEHYKAMTTIVFVIAILKFLVPPFFWVLEKISDRSHRKKLLKIWTDAGYSDEEARLFLEASESHRKKPKPSIFTSLKKLSRRKVR